MSPDVPADAVPLQSVVRIGGPFPAAIKAVMGGALIADSFEAAARIAPTVPYPVATLEGDVFPATAVQFAERCANPAAVSLVERAPSRMAFT